MAPASRAGPRNPRPRRRPTWCSPTISRPSTWVWSRSTASPRPRTRSSPAPPRRKQPSAAAKARRPAAGLTGRRRGCRRTDSPSAGAAMPQKRVNPNYSVMSTVGRASCLLVVYGHERPPQRIRPHPLRGGMRAARAASPFARRDAAAPQEKRDEDRRLSPSDDRPPPLRLAVRPELVHPLQGARRSEERRPQGLAGFEPRRPAPAATGGLTARSAAARRASARLSAAPPIPP